LLCRRPCGGFARLRVEQYPVPAAVTEISAILAGYSAVCAVLLCGVYLFSLPSMRKSAAGRFFCAALMLPIAAVQFCHVLYFMHGTDVLSYRGYLLLLLAVPPFYYFFSCEVLSLREGFATGDLLHLVLPAGAVFLPLKLGALTAFLLGCGYTLFIFLKTLRLRTHVPRFRFEKFFFTMFFGMNVVALVLGLTQSHLDVALYYHAYSTTVAISLVLVSLALLVFPELLSDVLLASETVYAKTKLAGIDVNAKREQLTGLMEARFFDNPDLTLGKVADQLELSGQQLSELVNSGFSMSFPRYIRMHRVEAAKQMLMDEPDASVLSISMATGFKSQSAFYTAFKEQTSQTPAEFRRDNAG